MKNIPIWANWSAIDWDGSVKYFEERPVFSDNHWWANKSTKWCWGDNVSSPKKPQKTLTWVGK